LLCGMEQACRPALAHHVHRTAPMGPRVLINGIWYNTLQSANDVRMQVSRDPLNLAATRFAMTTSF
jgi:hypothetical protein